ncbi:MAG: adenylate/guanylate cyclase domain-containing protein, partial [Thermomicrobiales bacterium]|nr:adenylate/guanylate cyclase domain-containing protein [Thermomicrobiales bacterium]
FLFTDIEGSTRTWEQQRPVMARAVARHDALLAEAVAAHGGVLFKHVGDAVQAAFHSPAAAVAAAGAAQRALAAEPWPAETGPLRVRMGVHQGEAQPGPNGDYNQIPCLNRLSRLMSAGHGGQVLISDAVREAVAEAWPPGVTLRDLGEHRLRDLLAPERIWQLDIAGLPTTFPPIRTLGGHPGNLPVLSAPLLGREQELADIRRLLQEESARLVTLIGPGGVGKTHLAQQAGAELLDDYPGGVWFVPLAEVRDPAQVLPALAAALGVREGGGLDLPGALREWLAGRKALLLLDNLEQVVAAAPAISELLAAAPQVQILATSRQRLGIGAERLLPVEPLLGTRADDAVRLFAQRAQQVLPSFSVTPENQRTVAAICARLDGLPLAIELAAAQLRFRTLAELRADLERRFELLVDGRREAAARQRSLAATIAWSYDLLSPELQQQFFRRLAVFAGGWSREAATALAPEPDALSRLLDLADASLVRREVLGETSRWSMLESVRAYAREELQRSGELAEAQRAHAAWCLAFAVEAEQGLRGPAQESWLARLDLEHDNLRVALRWLLDGHQWADALRLAAALGAYWQTRGLLAEGRQWLEAALAAPARETPAGLAAMIEAGMLAWEQGDIAASARWLEQAQAAATAQGDAGRAAAVLCNLAAISLHEGDLAAAEARYREALGIAEALGDVERSVAATEGLGAIAHYNDDLPTALAHYMTCVSIWRRAGNEAAAVGVLLELLLLLAPRVEHQQRARVIAADCLTQTRALGDRPGEALARAALGLVETVTGNLAKAEQQLRQSLGIAREIGHRGTEARALAGLTLTALRAGHPGEARVTLAETIPMVGELGEPDALATSLLLAALLRGAEGAAEPAATLLGAEETLRAELGLPVLPELRAERDHLVQQLTVELGPRYAAAIEVGAAQDAGETLREALRAPEETGDDLFRDLDALLALGGPLG